MAKKDSGKKDRAFGTPAEIIEEAERLLAAGDIKKAIGCLSDALELEPGDSRIYQKRGDAYLKSGNFAAAIKDFSAALEINPQLISARFGRGFAFDSIREYGRALEDYSAILKISPDGHVYYNRALCYFQLSRLDEAIEDLTKAILNGVADAKVYNNRGDYHMRKGDLADAMKDFDKALELEPDYAGAHYNKGLALNIQEDYQGALGELTKAIELKPDFAKPYLHRGNSYKNLGRGKEALADYSKSIELEPRALAFQYRGELHEQMEEADLALKDYCSALNLDQNDLESRMKRARLYGMGGSHDKARKDLDFVIEKNPKLPKAHFLRGTVNFLDGEYKKAADDYGKALFFEPGSAHIYNERGEAFAHLGRYEDADKDFTRAALIAPEWITPTLNRACARMLWEHYDSALKDLETLMCEPDTNIAFLKAICDERAGRENDELEDYGALFSIDCEEKGRIRYVGVSSVYLLVMKRLAARGADLRKKAKKDGMSALRYGVVLYRSEDFGDAIKAFSFAAEAGMPIAYLFRARCHERDDEERAVADVESCIKAHPDFAKAYSELCRLTFLLKDTEYEKAIEHAGRAIELDPDDAEAYYYRGRSFNALEKRKEAAADFSRAIELWPNFTDARVRRGIAYFWMDDEDKALKDLSDAVRYGTESVSAFYFLGLIWNDKEDFGRALNCFNKAIELDGEDGDNYVKRGIVLLRMKRYAEAISDFDRAITLDGSNAQAYEHRGHAHTLMDDFPRALEDRKKAAELEPENAGYHCQLGLAYEATGDSGRALESFRKALELDPELKDANDAVKRLKGGKSGFGDMLSGFFR